MKTIIISAIILLLAGQVGAAEYNRAEHVMLCLGTYGLVDSDIDRMQASELVDKIDRTPIMLSSLGQYAYNVPPCRTVVLVEKHRRLQQKLERRRD